MKSAGRILVGAVWLVAPCASVSALVLEAGVPTEAAFGADYVEDVKSALDQLEERCGHFFQLKGIDWKGVREQFEAEAEEVETDTDHLVLLVRLLARLEDGHASVRRSAITRGLRWPDPDAGRITGAGMFWCRAGGKVYVKSVWNEAEKAGLEPGMEVLKVDGRPVDEWLERRVATLADTWPFSTDHHADFFACHQGLAFPPGKALELELKTTKGKKKKRKVSYKEATWAPWGPAVFPEGMKGSSDLRWIAIEGGGRAKASYGYVHVRRCPAELPERMDEALTALGDVDGVILDFRGNSGGGFDHDALFGRFVPAGKSVSFAKRIDSAGPNPYGGPMVVIVDATVRSAGETAAGMFKEDGRAYMIGESPTAGTSSSKATLELPSGLFSLYVSVASNKARFNGGKGVEGVGVVPHELVEFDPEDLADGKDTLVERAKELLARFPKGEVPYEPAKFGWRR